jgi:hypothetical protein
MFIFIWYICIGIMCASVAGVKIANGSWQELKYEIENDLAIANIPVWGNYVIFFALIIFVWPRLFWEAWKERW